MTSSETVSTLGDLPLFDATLIERLLPANELWLIGWRCGRCHRLAFGVRAICPVCGGREGHTTRLNRRTRLETWTTVYTGEGDYTVAYCMAGDGEDDQEVRVFGPVAAGDEDELHAGQPMWIAFDHSLIGGRDCVHHVFHAHDGDRDRP